MISMITFVIIFIPSVQGMGQQAAGALLDHAQGGPHQPRDKRGGRVPLTELLLPRIARQGAVCLISIRG